MLYDTFHESNTKDPRDILRKISLVPELAGKINSQVVEQFFSQMRKNNSFLNNAAPATNIFLLRSIVHHHNQRTNNEFIKRARKTFVTDTEFNDYGQAVLCTDKSLAISCFYILVVTYCLKIYLGIYHISNKYKACVTIFL